MRALTPRRILLALAAVACGSGAWADLNPEHYRLPLATATEWQVLVFGARFPAALQSKPVAFAAKATWQTPAGAESKDLSGNVAFLKTSRLSLAIPAGCTSLAVALDWQASGVDLDLGLECAAPMLRLAPILTVVQPEKVRFDSQTAPFYEWLTARHPDWWKGYPFWAEVQPAPKTVGRPASP